MKKSDIISLYRDGQKYHLYCDDEIFMVFYTKEGALATARMKKRIAEREGRKEKWRLYKVISMSKQKKFSYAHIVIDDE